MIGIADLRIGKIYKSDIDQNLYLLLGCNSNRTMWRWFYFSTGWIREFGYHGDETLVMVEQ